METKKAEEIKRQWNLHSRSVPSEFYDVCEIDWVIGEDIMLKKDFEEASEILITSQQQTIERLMERNNELELLLRMILSDNYDFDENYEIRPEYRDKAEQLLSTTEPIDQ